MKTILLFGTFDGVHEGHRSCFTQAKEFGDHLILAIAPDAVVKKLKSRAPNRNAETRAKELKDEDIVDEVVVGDQEIGSYEVLTMIKPDLVGIGYDQHELSENLRAWASKNMPGLEIIKLEAFNPETFKSSKINQTN